MLTVFLLWIAAAPWLALAGTDQPFAYPKGPKADIVDEYHGEKVADPYRPLENTDAPETRAWIEAENKITFGFLDKIPERDAIKKRLTKLWDFEKFGIPSKEGGRYFYTRNDGLQNQSPLYWAPSLDAAPKLLIDPNTLSADGTVALSGSAVSNDGKLIAYGLAAAGSDWQEWKVREVESGKDLPDVIKWVKFSGAAWTNDNKGFFYSRYDEPKAGDELKGANYFQKLFYHKLGTPQSEDKLVYDRPDQKEWGFGAGVTDDGKYLIISVWKGTERKNLLFYKDLSDPAAKVVELVKEFEAQYNFAGNDGPVFTFHTDLDAPRGRVLAIDTRKPDRKEWKELIPQSTEIISSAGVVGKKLVVSYLKDARSEVKVFEPDGKLVRTVALPGIGTAGGFGGKQDDAETFYVFTGFTVPGAIYRYDIASGEAKLWRTPKVDFNPDQYETKQVFYNSKDGTKIPMFLTHRKGLKLDGDNPTLLYGYGGFNASITPAFSVKNLMWMELGGVYAVANLRGGGEYGKEWHEAGMKLKKQNVFDDFIAAAEWLIANKYTKTEKLAIHGGSNGGLLVGAVMTQRPELFGAAIPAVGVMDMLRFPEFTIGWAWKSDYGSPKDNAEEFKANKAYSPYHNLKPGTAYPPTLITTGDHDDRVHPGHSFKFAAKLQEMQSGPAPVLIRVQTKAGHGAGKPTTMIIDEVTDLWSFLVKTLDMKIAESPSAAPAEKPAKPSTG